MIYSDLEDMVMADMVTAGYNPHNPDDIRKYWEGLLNGN